MLNFNLDLNKIRQFYEDNEKTVRMAALILCIGLSILFFWVHGSSETVEIEGKAADSYEESEELSEEDEENEDNEDYEPSSQEASPTGFIYVDISGEVNKSGVYKVTQNTRLFEVIEMAGGLTDKADDSSLNRAEKVTDGQKVIVLSKEEVKSSSGKQGNSLSSGDEGDGEGKVNINTADSAELQSIPGIGPAKAQSIIDYREENGYFASEEDIMNVSGIGQKTYASIKDYIVLY